MKLETIQGDRPFDRTRQYSQVVIAEGTRTVYIVGQAARDHEGKFVGLGDMAAQARQVFANVEYWVERAGGTMRNVVKLDIYVTDMAKADAMIAARVEAFGDHRPAITLAEVRRLFSPDALLDVDAIAVL
jgi:enamine deaminase RidA (YjgF/YER057c/UK114 family)